MSVLNRDNFRKTISYIKRNGLRETALVVKERLFTRPEKPYVFTPVSQQELEKQRQRVWEDPVTISVVVPAYHTPEQLFRKMVQSVLDQTYPYFQLVIADAGEDHDLEELTASFGDDRITYYGLPCNDSISGNTNMALEKATGDYVALLDHDDYYTPDALYEIALRIEEGRKSGREKWMIYSDEDKCNPEATMFFEPNKKPDLNLELLFTNNYICHLLVLKTELIKQLGFRKEYDGAQDYDLVLRAVMNLYQRDGDLKAISHVDKVLYHWCCHINSTAANPESKLYAYEAGCYALEDLVEQMGWKAKAVMLPHLGFYRIEYRESIFQVRPAMGAVGGKIQNYRHRVCAGAMDSEGNVLYQGLPVDFSGYLNRAILTQSVEAVDLRNLKLNPACFELFKQIVGVDYKEDTEKHIFDTKLLPQDADVKALSLKLSKALREAGYDLLWDPQMVEMI